MTSPRKQPSSLQAPPSPPCKLLANKHLFVILVASCDLQHPSTIQSYIPSSPYSSSSFHESPRNRRDLPRDIPLDSVRSPYGMEKGLSEDYESVRLSGASTGTNPQGIVRSLGKPDGVEGIKKENVKFNTTAGNPVKEILLKLNLLDHKSILTDLKIHIKMEMEVPGSS
ncbi:hypothetical protein Tco_0890266 [Tanacetum coccineum]|uniref:Uncharacterized protein n=1 Tax=Tanacetum coccineum TaxID=301880 RepID=A0ABQ5C1D8_9ASTR